MAIKVHQMRALAPDKAQVYTDGKTFEYIKHDHTNLVDYDFDDLLLIAGNNEYILPADEGDILYANKMYNMGITDQRFILLPQDANGRIVEHRLVVPKDSLAYKELVKSTEFKYPEIVSFNLSDPEGMKEFEKYISKKDTYALKSSTGSGSRGVFLIDPNRIHLGGKFYSELTPLIKDTFVNFCLDEHADALVQDLIPYKESLKKVNVDFIIRNGRLLGYKWTNTDPTAVFTNWNFGWHVRTSYTDKIMHQLETFLTKDFGIYDAIMNFEAFTDMKSEIWMVEFNWRYSNSTFESQAAGIDMIACYFNDEEFAFPKGEHKFSRYWQCKYYDDIEHYDSK